MASRLPWAVAVLAVAAVASWYAETSNRSEPSGVDETASIQHAFRSVAEGLAEEGEALVADSALFRRLMLGDPQELAASFDELRERQGDADVGVELLDARGNILAWSGRTWNPSPAPMNGMRSGRRASVDRVGALVVLRVSVVDASGGRRARLHLPLAVETPGLERLFGAPVFSREITDVVRRRLGVVPPSEASSGAERIPLIAFARDTVAFAVLGTSGSMPPSVDVLTALLGALALFGVLMWCWLLAAAGRSIAWALMTAGMTWSFRFALSVLDLPSRWSLGDMTDARVYAAPSVGTLSATPVDVLLSALALFVSVWWIDRAVRMVPDRIVSIRSRWWAPTALSLLSLVALVILIRGYVVATRSLVVDSTITFYDPSSLWLTYPALCLVGALFFFTLTLRTAWVWTIRSLLEALHVRWIRQRGPALGVSAVIVTVAAAISAILQSFELIPWWMFAIGWAGAALIVQAEDRWRPTRTMQWVPHAFMVLILALSIIDHHVDLQRWQATERKLRARLQPGDSWFTFMVGSDLRGLSTDPDAAAMLSASAAPVDGRSAFRIWSRTLLSQQRLNSGVALFDQDGRELDRFMSGIGTFDQQTALRAVFDADEEVVQTIDLWAGGERRIAYGGWTTVRSADNVVHGTVALLLQASTEESIILSTSAHDPGSEDDGPVVEFEDGRALRSEAVRVPEGTLIPVGVEEVLAAQRASSVRRYSAQVGAELVYLRDPNDPGRTVAAIMPSNDVRWRLFHAVKISLVFALLSIVGAMLRPSWRAAVGVWLGGFQGRLFVAFSSIALIPLLVLAVSNQTISRERMERNQEETLRRDLALVQQRLSASILGEEDLERGLDDDFCRSVAADLGIEFSVFRSERLRASSRPELYTSGVLDARLPAEVFAQVQLRSAGFLMTTERIGALTYAVGYGTFDVQGRPAGIMAVPTLYRQAGIDEDLAERNAFLLVTASGVFLLVLVVGAWLSGLIAGPVRRLTTATQQLRDGRPPDSLSTDRRDEIGSLLNAFDRMASELDENRTRIAKAEREQAWREMAKQVAHEIKNPLTPMKLSLQHLRQAFRDQAKDRETLLIKVTDTVLEQVDALARIATEFSRFARLPERQFSRVDLHEAIREAVGLFRSVPGVTFHLDLPSTPAVVVADADELRRVFINLFRNSIQAMDSRGDIRIRGEHTGREVRITLRDTGPGVAPDARPHIFEPSFSTKTEGMGLGLAIVRSVIVDLGGSIELISDGPGASFLIIIPLH